MRPKAPASGAAATEIRSVRVFVAGDAPASRSALTILSGVLDALNVPGERVRVVDVLRQPAAALEAGVLVTPSLEVVRGDGPRWFVGDLTRAQTLADFLG